MANSNLSKSKQKEIKELIEIGRKQGYLTVSAINDLLPDNLFDNDQIGQITKLITDLKIKVVESAKDAEQETTLNDEEVTDDEDTDISEEEAVEVLSSLDEEFGRTSDPVRMYMREMGTVELLKLLSFSSTIKTFLGIFKVSIQIFLISLSYLAINSVIFSILAVSFSLNNVVNLKQDVLLLIASNTSLYRSSFLLL